MSDAEVAGLRAQVEALKQEKAHLLNELETSYRQMEEHLLASDREREIAYQELRERNRELQNRLEELERAHRELREAQRMLVRSERLAAMGEMAAAIVHELKNPLAVIIAQMSWILDQDSSPTKRSLERVLEASENLRDLVENVLGFARHHRGEAHDLDLNALLTELKAFVEPILKGAEVALDLEPDLPRVLADPAQIEQVLMNLTLNAVDAVGGNGRICLATSGGSIQEAVEEEARAGRPHMLAVEVGEETLAKRFVSAEVRDSGPGISEGHLAHLFEAFFTTKGEEKGTGLGLSIARTIVREWDGNILVSSTEGQGASFRVFLPPMAEGDAA